MAALFVDLLPCWRVHGGMGGATHLVEGFDRSEVVSHMELIGLTPAERRESWAYLSDMETHYRSLRAQAASARRQNA